MLYTVCYTCKSSRGQKSCSFCLANYHVIHSFEPISQNEQHFFHDSIYMRTSALTSIIKYMLYLHPNFAVSLNLLVLSEHVINPGPKLALEKIKRTDTIDTGAAVNVVEIILSTLKTAFIRFTSYELIIKKSKI